MKLPKPTTAADIVAHLRSSIKKQELAAGDKLPSERELSEQLKTSRVTAREALKQLEAEGCIYRANRRGWFVTPKRILYDPSRTMFFMNYIAEQGQTPFSTQLLKRQIPASAEIAEQMGIAKGEPLVELHRLRGANNRPLYIEQIFLRQNLLPGIYEANLEASVSRVIQETCQSQYGQIDLQIIASSLSNQEAEHLQAPAGCTCISIQRLSRNKAGEVIELDFEKWRHEALQLTVTLSSSSR